MKDGGPAYPRHYGTASCADKVEQLWSGGMSLRDWFAGQALIGSIERMAEVQGLGMETFPSNVAVHAYRVADAMLAQREKAHA